MATVLHMPMSLYALAKEAEHERDYVHLSPLEARAIADTWNADIEKVRYLESLLMRCAHGGGDDRAVLVLPALDAAQRKFLAAMLLRGGAFGPLEAGDPPP